MLWHYAQMVTGAFFPFARVGRSFLAGNAGKMAYLAEGSFTACKRFEKRMANALSMPVLAESKTYSQRRT